MKSIARASMMNAVGAASATLHHDAVREIAMSLKTLLADVFVLYLKTKNFHWHVGGPHFRDYHLLLDEQAAQILAMTDDIAERARKLGASTIRSIGDIARNQQLEDDDRESPAALDMLMVLHDDNQRMIKSLRIVHETCSRHQDFATTSLIETWIDETERRVWFLSQAVSTV